MSRIVLCWILLGGMLTAAAILPGFLQAEVLSEAKFREVLRTVRQAEDEPWRTIPWEIDLLEAQRLAANENKPMFIWAMDGHPLGCT